jgi:O-antigen ligase
MSESARRVRLILIITSLGALAVVLAVVPYKAFDLDRYFVPKELVVHVCATLAALVCVLGRRRLALSVEDAALAAFLIVSIVGALMAQNVWLASRAVALSCSGAALFWVGGVVRERGRERALVAALAFAVVVGAATSLLQTYGIQSVYFSLNRAPGGTFGNRNFVAHLCAIGVPLLVFCAVTARRAVGALACTIGLGILAAALVISRSRAAWLALIALGVIVGALALLARRRWVDARRRRRLVLLALGVGAGVAAAVLVPNRLNWNSDNPYLDSATGLVNYKQGSGRGRLVQYANSLKLTKRYPILGVGAGNWPVLYPSVARAGDPSMSDSNRGMTSNPWPSSDWVAFVSERGLLGAGLLLLVVVALGVRAIRETWSASPDADDAERVLTSLALIGVLVATVIVGSFDAVLLTAIPTLFVWLLAGVLAPPAREWFAWTRGVREFAPALVVVLGSLAILHSALELSAMSAFASSSRISAVTRAAAVHCSRGGKRRSSPAARKRVV